MRSTTPAVERRGGGGKASGCREQAGAVSSNGAARTARRADGAARAAVDSALETHLREGAFVALHNRAFSIAHAFDLARLEHDDEDGLVAGLEHDLRKHRSVDV